METDRAVEDAIKELAKPVVDYLRRYCGDDQLAEDLAQETLIRVARALPSFSRRSTLKTWGFTIATRVACDHFRRTTRSLPEVGFEDDIDFVDEAPALEQRLIVDEMNTCVREIIDTLPEDYRAALILRDLEGLSIAEVAGVVIDTLKKTSLRKIGTKSGLPQ